MKKINFSIKDKFFEQIFYFQRNNWLLTVAIFLIIFSFALVVWRDCVNNPQPSETILNNIIKVEQEYKTKMDKIKSNHEVLKAQDQNFDNPKRDTVEREYFQKWEEVENQGVKYTPNTGSYNPELFF